MEHKKFPSLDHQPDKNEVPRVQEESPVETPSSPPDPEIIRKLSKTVLHTAERRRQSLFSRMTAENSERVAELVKERPRFYEESENVPREIMLDDYIVQALPQSFFDNPTQWIEALPNIDRGHDTETLPTGETIEELWGKPYDVSRVKEFALDFEDGRNIRVISKRMEPGKTEEIARACSAFEAGIPTPRILGEIVDHGNVYVFYEHVPAISLFTAYERLGHTGFGFNDILFSHIPFTAFNDEKFNEVMDAPAIQHLLEKTDDPELARTKMYELWSSVRGMILAQEVYFTLISVGLSRRVSASEIPAFVEENMRRRFTSEEVSTGLTNLGFEGVDDLIQKLSELTSGGEREDRRNQLIERCRSVFAPAIDKFKDDFPALLSSEVFGFDPVQEKTALQSLCREKNIEHKDFADRNILVPWDFTDNRPARNPDDPKLYLIDWEAPKKSKA